MESLYEWRHSDIQTIRDCAQTAHDAMIESATLMDALFHDIEADTKWNGEHQLAFLGWIDLLNQYHTKMAADDTGAAAVKVLDDFLSVLSDYYESSAVFGLLKEIG